MLVVLRDRLIGLVVRRPPRERKVLGLNPACTEIFLGSSHTSDPKIGTPVATLLGAWRYRVSARTGRPGVSILWLGEVESLICDLYFRVAAHKIEQIGPRDTLAYCWDVKQPTNKQKVSQGRMCSDIFTCCHSETEVADQTFYLAHSQYTDTGPTSPSADPIQSGAYHWSANF